MEYFEYIKMLILGVLVGATAPLPVSSSAHFYLANSLLDFSADKTTLSFYYSFFMLAFSVVILVSFKNLYAKTFKGVKKNQKSYKLRMKNLIISLGVSLVLFIPLGEYGSIIDSFDRFMLTGNLLNPILAGIGCVFTGLLLITCLWAAKHSQSKGRKNISTPDYIKTAIYSLPSYVIPGFSKISACSVNLILRDVTPAAALREAYFYLAPQLLFVSSVRIITAVFKGISFDAVALCVGILFAALANFLVINLLRKVSIKKLFGFFSVYSVLLGVVIVSVALINH